MITLNFSLHSNPRGPGFWKLNTSLLTEIDYVNQIKSVIQETQNEYKDDESVNRSLLWEMIRLKVREKSLSYSKIKKKQTTAGSTGTNDCQTREGNQPQKKHRLAKFTEQLNEKKGELERIIETRTKGAILRSMTHWNKEGEKILSTF